MKIIRCMKCGAESTPWKWRNAGWLKVELFYDGGGKLVIYTCRDCRDKEEQARPASAGGAK